MTYKDLQWSTMIHNDLQWPTMTYNDIEWPNEGTWKYDKREDFAFRIANFPHMDSNSPANPAYGVYISQLVRNARICTSKVDFINRLRGLSLRLRQQGFETNLVQKSFNKFFSRNGLIVEKYGAALREMRLTYPGLNCTIVSLHCLFITWIFISVVNWYVCARRLQTADQG